MVEPISGTVVAITTICYVASICIVLYSMGKGWICKKDNDWI